MSGPILCSQGLGGGYCVACDLFHPEEPGTLRCPDEIVDMFKGDAAAREMAAALATHWMRNLDTTGVAIVWMPNSNGEMVAFKRVTLQ